MFDSPLDLIEGNPEPPPSTELDSEITHIFTIIDNYGTATEAREAIQELITKHTQEQIEETLGRFPNSLYRKNCDCGSCKVASWLIKALSQEGK